MAACTLDYNLNMEGFSFEDPLWELMGAIEIQIDRGNNFNLRPTVLMLMAKQHCLWTLSLRILSKFFNFVHVLASPEFRKLIILDMLGIFYFDPYLCECLRSGIESFATDAS